MRDISELNINEGGRPILRNSPSQNMISEFEDEFGISLPNDYIRFLKESNGGHPELNLFTPVGNSDDNHFTIDYFYHLTNDDRESLTSVWRVTRDWQQKLGQGCVPFGRDGGGNQLYLDFSSNEAIFLCIHDEDFKKIKVAPSFSAFLDLLEEDLDMI